MSDLLRRICPPVAAVVLIVGGLAGLSAAAAQEQGAVEPVDEEPLERPVENPKPVNPLERLFRGIFNKPPKRILPPGNPRAEADEDESGSTYERDYVDRCAPHNPELEKMLNKARRYLETGNSKVTIELLQQILDQPNNDLVGTGPGKSELVRDYVNRQLAGLPAAARESYAIEYGGVARQLWDESRTAGDPVGIAEVATRYLLTPAGKEAANYLAALHADRGEWVSASQWFERLSEFYPNEDRSPAWYLKAALVWRRAGYTDRAERVLKDDLKGLVSVELGGRSVSPEEFLNSIPARIERATPVLADWPQFLGNERHSAFMKGEPPLMVPRWRLEHTQSTKIREQVAEIEEDLHDLGRTTLPVLQPVLIGNKAIFRSFQGIAVAEASSGRRLWQTRQYHSPERLLTGRQMQSRNYSEGFVMVGGGVVVSHYQGNGAEQHPLTGLLYRDGMFGLVTADEKYVYAIEKQAWLSQFQPGYNYGNGAEENDQLKRSWTTNQLAAYDLESGRVAWEIGGEALNEPFDLPLAGTYFFGAPLADGDRLYVTGEKANEIHLFCLDRATGHPLWSQLIGYSLHSLNKDFGRRWWTAQPATADGVVVCSNTCGWLVAVDSTSHGILWEHRLVPTQRSNNHRHSSNNREGLVERRDLNDEWTASAPIISNGKVYYAPKELDALICLDLTTGEREWALGRGNYRALVGIFNDRILLLNDAGLTMLDSEKKLIWRSKLEEDSTAPSGLPAVTEEDVYLPTESGVLWRLSLEDGKVLGKLAVAPGDRPLGNLAFHGGRLTSLDEFGMRAYDLKSTYAAELAKRRSENPDDAWCYLQESQRLLLEEDRLEALALLKKIRPDEFSRDADRERYRAVMYRTLETIARSEPTQHDELFRELESFVESEWQRLDYWQLKADRLVAQGKFRGAFDEYLRIADSEDLTRLIPRGGRYRIRVRLSHWLAGRIDDLMGKMPEELRADADGEIERRADALEIADDPAAAQRFLSLFRGHSASEGVRSRLANWHIDQKHLAEAEFHLVHLTGSSDRRLAAESWMRLLMLYHQHGRAAALWQAYQTARAQLGDERLYDRPAGEILDEMETSWVLKKPKGPAPTDWGEFDLQVETGAMNYQVMQRYQGRLDVAVGPILGDFRVDYNLNSRRLSIERRGADDERAWSIPLQNSSYYYGRTAGSVSNLRHVMIVEQGNTVSLLSPAERRVLWQRSTSSNYSGRYYRSRRSSNGDSPGMTTVSRLSNQYGLIQQMRESGGTVIAGDYVCIPGSRDLHAFDLVTGNLVWSMEKLPNGTLAFGGGDSLYLITPNEGDSLRIRVGNAEPEPLGDRLKLLKEAIALVDEDAVVVESRRERLLLLGSKTITTVRRTEVGTGKDVWTVKLDGNLLLQPVGTLLYALDQKSGELSRINLSTGEVESLQTVEALKNNRSPVTLVESTDRILLLQNNAKGSNGGVYRNYYLPGIFVNGVVHALDRETGRMLWSTPVKSKYLMTEMVDESPVLLFTARRSRQQNNIYVNEHATVILDSNTGRRLYDHTGISQNDIQVLHLDRESRRIQMLSYNQKTSFRAVKRKAEAPKEPAPESSSGEDTSSGGGEAGASSSR